MVSLAHVASLAFLLSPAAYGQGYSVELNGVNGFGTAAGVGGLVANSTWEAWIEVPSDANAPGCVLQRWGMYSHALALDPVQGTIGVDMYSCWTDPCGQTVSPPGTIARNTWQHIALVYGPESAPSCEAYVDGQPVAWCGPQQCTPYAGWETVLGAWGNQGYVNFFRGRIDEARISNVPRYSANFTPTRFFTPDANTVGLWHFDEGGGNVALDASGNGRHFTLQGGYSWSPGLSLCHDPQSCCVNGPATYCSAKVNSLGCLPSIGHAGAPTLSGPDNFHITASNVLNDKYGMLLWSTEPHSVPFVGGTLCIRQPFRRTLMQESGGTAGSQDCSGTFDLHLSQNFMFQMGLTSGQMLYAQYWYRDPGFPVGFHVGLTNGLKFSICP